MNTNTTQILWNYSGNKIKSMVACEYDDWYIVYHKEWWVWKWNSKTVVDLLKYNWLPLDETYYWVNRAGILEIFTWFNIYDLIW
jgi:hypothetical protein